MARPYVYAFEAIDDTLPFMPLAARRLLDAKGRKLSLDGWLSLSVEARWLLVRAGAMGIGTEGVGAEGVETQDPGRSEIADCLSNAAPPASFVARVDEPGRDRVPPELRVALGPSRPIDDARWRSLSALDRYALVKCSGKADKLERAYDEIVRTAPLTHLSESGDAKMVDIAGKQVTSRCAVASSRVRTTPAVIRAIADGAVAKGDVLAAARIAGIMASKRTSELIPLCHPVQTTSAHIDLSLDPQRGEVTVLATVEAMDRTGVEMEAMIASAIASLTIYDMIKGADRWAIIESVRLERKSGGKSGDVMRPGGRELADPTPCVPKRP